MRRTQITSLVWVALAAVPVGWLVGVLVDRASGTLPPVPFLLPLLLVFLAAFLFTSSRVVSAWVNERRYDTRIDALRVARLLALAKASQFFGAFLVGTYAGIALLALDVLSVPIGRNRLLGSGAVMIGAVLLVYAAMRLERACVVPPKSNDES